MFANSHLIPSCDGGKANTVFVILLARNKISNMARRAFKEKIPQQFGDDCHFFTFLKEQRDFYPFIVTVRLTLSNVHETNSYFLKIIYLFVYFLIIYTIIAVINSCFLSRCYFFFFPHSLEVNNINKQTNTACYLREMSEFTSDAFKALETPFIYAE